jgi:hypothetical protein
MVLFGVVAALREVKKRRVGGIAETLSSKHDRNVPSVTDSEVTVVISAYARQADRSRLHYSE